MPLGGIRLQDAKRVLTTERGKDTGTFSSTFALEIAYIIEHYGEDSESEAREILELYMNGAKSLVLAVAFAQRNKVHSSRLWEALVEHCLSSDKNVLASTEDKKEGILFGSLLEAAALYGADLAKLVTQIPPGMAVEGLRPRLVAAVADYRLKLSMHETASEMATQEMVSCLVELSHRSRRGVRYQLSSKPFPGSASETGAGSQEAEDSGEHATSREKLNRSLRTLERKEHQRLGLPLPIR